MLSCFHVIALGKNFRGAHVQVHIHMRLSTESIYNSVSDMIRHYNTTRTPMTIG